MTGIRLISMNCRGLGDIKKRKDVFMFIKKYKADLFCLQDVHVRKGKENSFRNAWGRHSIVAAHSYNSRGVAIMTSQKIRRGKHLRKSGR